MIDTTASMTPVIGDLALSLASVVRVLERMVPSIRIGISAYNDRDTGQVPVVSLPPTLANEHLDRVIAFLGGSRPRPSAAGRSRRMPSSASRWRCR